MRRGRRPAPSTATPSTPMVRRSRGSSMHDAAAWARRLVPPPLRERVFDPAMAEAARERRIRRRRARSAGARAGIELLYLQRAVRAALECRALARDARQPFDAPRARMSMTRHDLVFA